MQIVTPPRNRAISVALFVVAAAVFSSACSGAQCHDGQTRCNADGSIGTCNTYANCGDDGVDCDTVWESQACPTAWSCQTPRDLSGDSAPTCLPTNLDSSCQATPVESAILTPTDIAVLDINGDGKLDFVAVGASTSAFLGRGDGTFDAGPISSAGWNAFELTSADFNGDGHADLLGLATTTNGATVLEESDGDGEGNFGAPFARAGAPTIGVFHGPPLAGDANEDGKADVVQDATLLIAGASAATIAWPDACDPSSDPAQIGARALVDLDGDHHLDLAALGSLGACVLYGDGKGSFANGGLVTSSPAGGSTLFVADFDGDGQSDLAIAPPSAATRVMILFNRGSRLSFDSVSLSSPSTAAFAGALTADIDGDGRADWVAGTPSLVTTWVTGANGEPGDPVYHSLQTMQQGLTLFALAPLHGGKQVDALIGSGNVSVLAKACN